MIALELEFSDDDPVCPPGALPKNIKPQDSAIFASILPEGKFDLVNVGVTSGLVGVALTAGETRPSASIVLITSERIGLLSRQRR
jgi:hypothetical protein